MSNSGTKTAAAAVAAAQFHTLYMSICCGEKLAGARWCSGDVLLLHSMMCHSKIAISPAPQALMKTASGGAVVKDAEGCPLPKEIT